MLQPPENRRLRIYRQSRRGFGARRYRTHITRAIIALALQPVTSTLPQHHRVPASLLHVSLSSSESFGDNLSKDILKYSLT